jgi:hypothetical protein
MASSRLNDKNNKKLQQKNEKILEELSKMPGNNHCCDCGATGKFSHIYYYISITN